MRISTGTLQRTAAPALAAGLALAALAAPAAAQEPPGSRAVRSGGWITVNAFDGHANMVSASVRESDDHVIIEDAAGVEPGPGCEEVPGNDGTAVDCGPLATATRLVVELRDQSDSAFLYVPISVTVNAGTGPDQVYTDGGNDTINLRDGVRGNDRAACNGGNADTAVGNPGDTIATDCERRAFY